MKSVEKTIFNRICSNRAGWVFSNKDFSDTGGGQSIDTALCRLLEKGEIRRVCRGVYDKPKYNNFLREYLSPDIEQVAAAIARRSSWRIYPSENLALNLLGLSTQVPGRIVYVSDGPQRTVIYDIFDTKLEIRRVSLKEMAFEYYESSLIIQALKALGDEYISKEIIKNIQSKFTDSELKNILKDTQYATAWIRKYILMICGKERLSDG